MPYQNYQVSTQYDTKSNSIDLDTEEILSKNTKKIGRELENTSIKSLVHEVNATFFDGNQ